MTANPESSSDGHEPLAAEVAARFTAQEPDQRLAGLLANYPDHLFSRTLYASIEAADRFVTELAITAAGSVGFLPQLVAPRSVADVQRQQGLAEAFSPALAWLLERLAAAGLLTAETVGSERRFVAVRPFPDANPALFRDAARLIDPANTPTCDLLDAAAAVYPAIARGETSGREALLGAGQLELWLRYFSNDNPLYAVNNGIAATAAVERLAERARSGSRLRILEVGAGAGSGSERLLDLLQQRDLASRLADFRVTEPSALFARKSRRLLARFRDLPLAFAGLDIDRPWDGQGVEPGSVDLVYAVNVLHVARDLGFTLREARRALAPGGWLVAGECLRPDAHAPLYVELVFRLLQDEGIVRHPEQRPQAGFLEWRHWQAALAAAGFASVTAEPDHERIRAIYPKLFVAAVCGRVPG
jgi:SAM-dependent methyltransferase